MRIHTLTFQAIGPYATSQHLDFTQLDDVGLFLLDGPTGAGKSTILDIVTFALYGKADDERKNTELHSTLAEPGLPPTIQLDVTFGTRRFIIDRTLQHFAPRRGAKDPLDVVTRQAAMSLVEIVAGEHRQLTTRVDEAQQILRGVIGLSREQFTSVVLLPQGEFARFLKASSNDREAILRQLFNTHRFDEIGDYLAAEAKKLRGTLQADTQRRDTLRASLIETAQTCAQPHDADSTQPATEPADLETLDDVELIAHTDRLMSELATGAQRRVEQSQRALKTARDAFQQLQQQQEHLREAEAYRRRHTAHQKQAPAVRKATLQLEHHERARAVVEAQRHCQTAQTALADAVETLQQRCDAAQQDPSIIDWAGQQPIFTVDAGELQPLLAGWKTVEAAAIRALEHVAQHEKTQATIQAGQRQLDTWTTSQQTLSQRIGQLQEQFDTVCEQLTADRQRAEHFSGVEKTLETATQQLQEAKTKYTAAQKAQTAQSAADGAKRTLDETQTQADAALEHAQDLLRRRIEAAAGFLADKLEPGQPCEVCGSTTHPQPAETLDLAEISNDAVQQAQQRATQARRAANTAAETYQLKLTDLQELQTQAGGLCLTDAEAAVTHAQQTVAEAQREATELTQLRTRIKEREAQTEQLREAKTTVAQQLTEVTTQIASQTTELAQLRDELAAALGDFPDVAALRAAVEPAHRLVGQIVRAGQSVTTAVANHTTAQQRVHEALANSATQDHPAYQDAAEACENFLDPTTQAEYETLVRQWTTESDRLAEKAGQTAVIAGLKLLDDDVAPPSEETLEAAQQAQRAAEQALSEANREHGSIEATHKQCRTHQDLLTQVSERSAEQLAIYEELVGLSDVVAGRGENTVSMPLRSFVLAGWLEHVAANASERLTGMTGGRYELKHAVGQGGRGHSGLNLEVIDHLNDTVRTPSTLSGGETFMASLALALGLADAVQAQAGGVAMDTLFIDEGFGSLDADTLEEVMGVLAALQDDGRLIGLVSHVESMKQQIPYRIQVQKLQSGSTVNIVGPDLA
ncbi:MAG TPA: SMC family ATPase [Enteractinococcus helveticum]|uniref:Nuclease SbcCD subunit C n=1 Tax=Enteractinococcus helveticum TaxID=1837282 RepID=A0A921K7D9_9MICC|nr:SMC family ATPase [Enteractinococcus helveticum]HJF14527.1 SMC family ATPase [Enteractinococcus helveticum]